MDLRNLEQLTDNALMSRVAVGIDEAVGPLLSRYQRPLLSLLRRLTGSTQETWIRVIRSARSFDPAQPFRPWLFRIAWNLFKSSRKFPHDRPGSLAEMAEAASSERPAIEGMMAAELHRNVRAAIATLPLHLSETILLRFFEELSGPEIAARLGVPIGTVKSRVHTALKQLATLLVKESSQ
ncbi:MAG TPA: sigma-70 family RNA polymerase sigma factor [Thermoanaerobaculia bacterium]|nr:sigma-70 family RNA polymerase sigma factor [Thermoanaerobaculia bacterium]